jgi:hypothetical protein
VLLLVLLLRLLWPVVVAKLPQRQQAPLGIPKLVRRVLIEPKILCNFVMGVQVDLK